MTTTSSPEDAGMFRTPVPTDWQHAKILMGRHFRKDYQKPKLYFAKFLLLPCLLMLYCIGFLISFQDYQPEVGTLQGGFELFPGHNWTYPQTIRLAGSMAMTNDGVMVESIATTMTLQLQESLVDVEWSNVTNRTEFLEDCQDISASAAEEVCVYLDAMDNYTIFYGGQEEASPFQSALAGAQWAVNVAILETLGVSATFSVLQIQQTPQKVSSTDNDPPLIVLLLPPVMQVLACAVASQFLIGPMTYEKLNHVTESFLFVGVKLRTYLWTWIGYYSMHFIWTATLLTVVSIYWNLMPQSSPGLIGLSHYLGLVHMISQSTLIVQFIHQEELSQSFPFISGIFCLGIGAGLLVADMAQSILMYLLSVFLPFVGMMQYYGIYILYDYAGLDTGIHYDNVVSSGLLGSYMAQIVGIILYWILCALYGSESFYDWISGHGCNKASHDDDQQDVTRTIGTHESNTLSGDDYEPLKPGANVVIRVRGVEHTYRPGRFDKSKKVTQVLKGLDMDICRGEVFGYLGHNGAGKTTSVNILADQIKLQKGSVTYHFRDGDCNLANSKDIHTIRNKIGVCPQHNTSLQEDLTARETLRLFAHLKGGIAQERPDQSIADAVEAEVQRRLNDVKFTSVGDSDKPVGTYSGGMKRKVLIAMSLLGDPEVVFLDEPTAGLDPYNRRSIWDMIVAAKQGRSIILTTHFLDEADVLSDRVGIIKNGSLITCGSSLFLKHAFGVGYTLEFEAPHPIALDSLIPQAEPVGQDQNGRYQWRLGHGLEDSFPQALKWLKSQGASNVQLDLTTLEQVFLETGKEDEDEVPATDEGNDEGNQDVQTAGEVPPNDDELVARIWEPRCRIKPISWWSKLYLVQNFMMVNAWKSKEIIFLNISFPLIYLIVGIALSALFVPELEGEIITSNPISISTGMAGEARFFGVPEFNNSNPIAPLVPAEPPLTLESYYEPGELPYVGGHYDGNSTLQYANEVTPFALQLAANILSNYTALLEPSSRIDGIASAVQQLPYSKENPFRPDLLFIPFCLSFGFAGLAFSVLDVLLLKGNNIITLFRVAGITEWTTYVGVMAYKFTTTFFPFFTLLVVLGFSVGLVLFGNAGRWLGSLLLMFAYAYSSTPTGLILAKRFIHADFKSVANWFPGVYFTFAGVPYIVYSSLLQAFPESEDLILIVGDILCIIPQVAFQRGLGAVLEISNLYDDPELTWRDVWSFDQRLWFTILIMCFVGTVEWYYLYILTTTREKTTKLSKEDNAEELTTPLDVSADPAISAERERSLVDDQGINARDLVKIFKDSSKKGAAVIKRSVKGMSFGIRQNEILALLGPNGAGKTCTMSILAGQMTPEHGEVSINGVVVDHSARSVDPLFANCQVSYVPQFDALFPNQSVEEHLKFYARIRGLDWDDTKTQEHVNSIVKLLGLDKHRQKYSDQLSGGYKRRLCLALALIGYPKAMMMDEVTTGLDPGARRLIWDILKPRSSLCDWNVPAMLLSTHYMEEAEELGDRIVIMIDGEVSATGALTQLYDRYCTSFFVEISLHPTANDDNSDKILGIFNDHGLSATVYESLPYHLKLQVPFHNTNDDTTQQLADLFELLEGYKDSLEIKFYSVAKMNLEQIFIDLSRKQLNADAQFQSERQLNAA